MTNETVQNKIERLIIVDKRLGATTCSCVAVLAIFINLQVLPNALPAGSGIIALLIGIASSLTYFLINGVFLGHLFFDGEFLFKLVLGDLLLLALLGFVAWLVLIVSYLDIAMIAAVLLVGTTIASLLNRLGSRLKK